MLLKVGMQPNNKIVPEKSFKNVMHNKVKLQSGSNCLHRLTSGNNNSCNAQTQM